MWNCDWEKNPYREEKTLKRQLSEGETHNEGKMRREMNHVE
jgi:hypothetical protein